jgi:hypothetical protein
MDQRKILRLVHLLGTIWLMLCLAFVLETALRQAGFNWWVIFSLSGHSALLIFLLVSLYLFALFGAGGKEQRETIEHPLTSTGFYMAFYVSAPLIGAAASLPAILEMPDIRHLLSLIALSTFGATFLTWIIVDPAISLCEVLTPAAGAHRQRRLAAVRAQHEQQQQDRKRQVEEVLAKQEQLKNQWIDVLKSQAQELAGLLEISQTDLERAEKKAVDIGVGAWQMGGLDCMRQLHKMALELYEANLQKQVIGDYVVNWWDGIGTWRIPFAK